MVLLTSLGVFGLIPFPPLCRWQEHHLPEDMQERCYFFNSFFYKKLTEKQKAKKGGAKAGEDAEEEWDQHQR